MKKLLTLAFLGVSVISFGQSEDVLIRDVEIVSVEEEVAPQPIISATFVQDSDRITFSYHQENPARRDIGCSGSSSSYSFSVVQPLDSTFRIKGRTLRKAGFHASHTGGLYYSVSKSLTGEGYITGNLQPDGTWEIQFEVEVIRDSPEMSLPGEDMDEEFPVKERLSAVFFPL